MSVTGPLAQAELDRRTIERLQEENKLLKKENEKAWLGRQSVINDRQKARKERDAALAEVERLKGQLQAAETSIQAHRGFVRS